MYSASQRTLDSEQKLRQQLEQEIETQKGIRQEKEVSVCEMHYNCTCIGNGTGALLLPPSSIQA